MFMPSLNGGSPDETRALLDRWVETRKLISEEKSQWKSKREQLERTVELLEKERSRLLEDIARLEARTGASDLEMSRLREEDTRLEETLDVVESRTSRLEEALPSLMAGFPPNLQERTRPLVRNGPGEEDDPDPSLAGRLQRAIGFLSEGDRFQENIQVVREVISPEGKEESEVRVLYLGLGQAYYLGPDGKRAGGGRPGENGWEWIPEPGLAPDIRHALAIYDNEAAPEFVRLPVTLRHH